MEKLLDFLDRALVEWVGASLIGLTALVSFVQVITRNVLNFTTVWGDELPRYAVILAVFLALGEGWRHGRNLSMTLVVDRLPGWVGRIALLFRHLVGLAVAAYLCYSGLLLTLQQYRQHLTTGSSLNLPAWIPSVAIPLGAGLLAFAALAGAIRTATGRPGPPDEPEERGS